MKTNLLLLSFLLILGPTLLAQDHAQLFQDAKKQYESKAYYEAHRGFKAALLLSEKAEKGTFSTKCKVWKSKAGLALIHQFFEADSLLQARRKLVDALYFWDGRFALAFNQDKYGFINRQGETVIDYVFDQASSFDEETGYARVKYQSKSYWISAEGGDKAYDITVPLEKLPKVGRSGEGSTEPIEESFPLIISLRKSQGFGSDIDSLSTNLTDSTAYQIQQYIMRASEAIVAAERVRDMAYFYDNRFGVAFRGGQFFFINKDGIKHNILGSWKKAEPFENQKGFAKVFDEKGRAYLLDTLGRSFLLASSLEELGPEIRALDMRNNYMGPFPVEIFQYPELEVLILDENIFNDKNTDAIPVEIAQLNQLIVLSLHGCNRSSLPASIGKLKLLEKLELSGNMLRSLPPEIGQLQQLQILFLRENRLKSLPAQIGNLSQLKALDVSINQLEQLPPEIGQLQQLQTLAIFNNQLTNLPPEIGQLQELTWLILLNNEFAMMPSAISNLHKLKGLYLRNNNIKQVPSQIGQLQQLEELDLTNNQLESLPAKFGKLQQLKRLYLSVNNLTELPATFEQLHNLQLLDLNDNKFSSVPSSLLQLHSLKKLVLINNPLPEVDIIKIRKLLPACEVAF